MIKRVIDISEAAYLHLKNRQLKIAKEGVDVGSIPIEDLGVLILQNPAIIITQALVIACQKENVVIVFCDERHLPYSVSLPIWEGNTLHTKHLKYQIEISLALKKRIWQQIIKNKIEQQSTTLRLLDKETVRLDHLSSRVKSGDAGNTEAIAAQAYWKLLFGSEFKRNVDLDGINQLLNYGYSIVRGLVARAICGAGLHPSLGLFHSNQYNSLCLADDLMEPFRPWIDYIVFNMSVNGHLTLTQENKAEFLRLLSEVVIYNGKEMPFMVAIHYLLADLKRCYRKERTHLIFPELKTRLLK